MSAAITAKAAPSAAAIEEMGRPGLEHLARTSNNREVLAAVLAAAAGYRPVNWRIDGNPITSRIVRRAVANRWDDVLEAALASDEMVEKDYATALTSKVHAPETVHAAILRDVRALPSILAMFHRVTPYKVLKEIAMRMRLATVTHTLLAVTADPAAYAVDAYGDEDVRFAAAVNTAFGLDRLDLVTDLINTGCAGAAAIDRAQMWVWSSAALEIAVLNYLHKEVLDLAA
ncbi:MAG TPA: hypothetical protein VF867_07375 [Arthrobacter sp.]